MKRGYKEYYIQKGNGMEAVEGKEIKFNKFPFEFFTHFTNGAWTVSENSTGLKISNINDGFDTTKKAIISAESRLNKAGLKTVTKLIKEAKKIKDFNSKEKK